MLLISSKQAKEMDRYITENIGIPLEILAEHAGMAVASIYKEKYHGKKVDIFAGKGMNGVDALVCARKLHSFGVDVRIWTVFSLYEEQEKDRWQYIACKNLKIPIWPSTEYEFRESSTIIDGIFGTSFDINRPLDKQNEQALLNINNARIKGVKIIAIDIPSGVDSDNGQVLDIAVKASETITFLAPKIGMLNYPGRLNCGNITLSTLGLPEGLIENFVPFEFNIKGIDISLAAALLPSRKEDGHKGTFGSVGIVGGSDGMAGAVCMCAKAVYKCGAGLVYLVIPQSIKGDCLLVVPEALAFTNYNLLPSEPDVLVIGPGGGTDEEFKSIVFDAIEKSQKLVLDARALRVIAKDKKKAKELLKQRLKYKMSLPVITPHPGEMKDLIPDADLGKRIETAKKAAVEYSCICVLKGAGTVIASPDGDVRINTSGNSSMGKGGSGDVLAGMIGAIMAQGLNPFDSATFSAYFHGLCADIAMEESSEYSAMPTDIISNIPKGFSRLIEYTNQKVRCEDE